MQPFAGVAASPFFAVVLPLMGANLNGRVRAAFARPLCNADRSARVDLQLAALRAGDAVHAGDMTYDHSRRRCDTSEEGNPRRFFELSK